MRTFDRKAAGFTLAEMVMVAAVLAILAAVTLPIAKYTSKRSKELDLRQHLREMRLAIDEYKRYSDAGLIPVDLNTDGYPKKLEILVEGVDVVGQINKKAKFLRRLPVDPMTGKDEWGMRSYQDKFDETSWGGENVYDVYSLSEGVGLNGVPYTKW
ncbi:MAG TPA: prepilin-type N-terminal cleavage/methylation domain-containing protein [Thermoanaerobaculia bacterium]|jgi:general secretion pathway protein G|nr:prepilin-type N-terminal cleavage/methylation domain-containing protein [Thermoanaerobaculia bacterium]